MNDNRDDDKAIDEIENHVAQLQESLKERLEETQSIDALSKKVSETTINLERSTSGLETQSATTRWKLMMELYKYYLIAGVIIVLLIAVLYKNIFK